MASRKKLTIKQQFEQEINRTVRNYNRKIDQLQSKGYSNLPDKLTRDELRASYTNTKSLQKKLDEMKRFSRVGSEKIVTTKGDVSLTKFELGEIKRRNKQLKTKLTKEIKEMSAREVKVAGKKQGITYAQIGDEELINLQRRRKRLEVDVEELSPYELKAFRTKIGNMYQTNYYRENLFKDNYIQIIEDLAYYAGASNEEIATLKAKLSQLKPDEFYDLYKSDKGIQALLDYYAPKSVENEEQIEDSDFRVLFETIIENIDDILNEN